MGFEKYYKVMNKGERIFLFLFQKVSTSVPFLATLVLKLLHGILSKLKRLNDWREVWVTSQTILMSLV